MKKITFVISAVLLVCSFSVVNAQDSDEPTVLVFSQNMVKMSDMGKANEMMDIERSGSSIVVQCRNASTAYSKTHLFSLPTNDN